MKKVTLFAVICALASALFLSSCSNSAKKASANEALGNVYTAGQKFSDTVRYNEATEYEHSYASCEDTSVVIHSKRFKPVAKFATLNGTAQGNLLDVDSALAANGLRVVKDGSDETEERGNPSIQPQQPPVITPAPVQPEEPSKPWDWSWLRYLVYAIVALMLLGFILAFGKKLLEHLAQPMNVRQNPNGGGNNGSAANGANNNGTTRTSVFESVFGPSTGKKGSRSIKLGAVSFSDVTITETIDE